MLEENELLNEFVSWWKISSIEVFAKERGIFFEKLQTFNDFELLSPKLSVL